MSDLEGLLVVQAHDSSIDQLRHRLATLPERAGLARVEAQLTALEADLGQSRGRRAEVARRQERLEDQVTALEARISDLDRRLYSGVISAPRELQALQADIDALRRQRSGLEDGVLEAMEEREPLDLEVSALEERRADLDAEAASFMVAVAEAEAQIQADLAAEEERRQEAAARLAAPLLSLYEDLRAKLDGVGAARLEPGGRCGGCHLTLPATEVARIKREPPDAIVQCDHCSRILVR